MSSGIDPLSDVQGNILKGFDKANLRLIFFRFGTENDATKKWLAKIAYRIPSTTDLISASRDLDKRRTDDPLYYPQEVWLHVSLSKSGIMKLDRKIPPSMWAYTGNGAKSKTIETYAEVEDRLPFTVGMKIRGQTHLGDIDDNAPANWVEPFKSANTYAKEPDGTEIDALFMVASDEEDDGDSYVLRLIEEATLIGGVCVGLQIGRALTNETGNPAEHFGFRDGVSQPLIKGVDGVKIEKRTINRDEFDPEDFVLFGLGGKLEWANNGSFLVFRRLRQNVPAFWQYMTETSESLEKKGVTLTPEELAAKFVGRWKSGAPLALHSKSDPVKPADTSGPIDPADRKEMYNDFVFCRNLKQTGSVKIHVEELDDLRGETTPRFSHIRKVNPRDDGRSDEGPDSNIADTRTHRILRRGIPYGDPWAINPKPDADRGLLFICYQRDLDQQFEYIQRVWSNNQEFPSPDRVDRGAVTDVTLHGPDPISGHFDPKETSVNLFYKKGSDQPAFNEISISRFVTMTGGEYFFSPSISALKSIIKPGN